MTREEAIKIIERVDICANAAETARNMAIDALREPLIVRCKDCKHYMTIHCTCDGCCIADDWYCADGERKDNDRERSN